MQRERSKRNSGIGRIIFYNVLVFFVAFNVLYWAIPTISSLSRAVQLTRRLVADTPPGTPVFATITSVVHRWGTTGLPPASYRSHVGWRRDAWTAEGVHVEGRYLQRRTVNPPSAGKPSVYFFGGSTMWGDGVTDEMTLPSLFAARTGLHAENFGEPGYTAHQSLSLLIQLLQDGHRPALVVFYDGANEPWVKCRAELNPDSDEREHQFRAVLRRSLHPDAFSHYVAPLLAFADNLHRELARGSSRGSFDCGNDPQKSRAIVDRMMQDWAFAKRLVEWHGGKFIGILQPVLPFSRAPSNLVDGGALALSEQLRPEFAAVYPLLRERVAEAGEPLHDLVTMLDGAEPVFTDFCHLTPRGNALVAEKISEIVAHAMPR